MARGYPVSMKLYDGYGLYHLHPYISFGLHIEERLERFVLYCKSLGSTRSRAGLVLRKSLPQFSPFAMHKNPLLPCGLDKLYSDARQVVRGTHVSGVDRSARGSVFSTRIFRS
jgi:hypothetical protein